APSRRSSALARVVSVLFGADELDDAGRSWVRCVAWRATIEGSNQCPCARSATRTGFGRRGRSSAVRATELGIERSGCSSAVRTTKLGVERLLPSSGNRSPALEHAAAEALARVDPARRRRQSGRRAFAAWA